MIRLNTNQKLLRYNKKRFYGVEIRAILVVKALYIENHFGIVTESVCTTTYKRGCAWNNSCTKFLNDKYPTHKI